MEENVDYISYTGSDMSSWYLFISGTARTAGEEYEEILHLAKNVFDATTNFYQSTKIVYGYKLCSPIASAYDLLKSPTRPTFTEVQNDNGLTYDQLVKSLRNLDNQGQTKYIRSVNFEEGKTLFSLKGTEVYIDKRSSGLYASYYDDEVLVPNPQLDDDPLIIELFHDILKCEDKMVDKSDAAYYRLVFRTHTGMWFARSEWGLINRQRLRDVFDRIYSNLNIVHAAFLSDNFSDDVLGLRS